ncbi:MAG TPA: hypothetical protein VMN78_10650 [Longimicrobiales bacterium]|nr:hypothetical protein [Longimicrobiales bacterium]
MSGPLGRGLASGIALCAGLTMACAEESESEGIDEETFVGTYVDLRGAVVADSLDAAVRDSILAAHDVTAADLRDYVDRHAANPDGLAETWRAILDSIAARDSAAAGAPEADSL